MMNRTPLTLRAIMRILLIAACASLFACSGGSEDEGEAASSVDPRFATPDALIEYFNSLNTQLPPDLPNLLPLYHLETDFQRKKHQVLAQSLGPYHDLEVAMWRQFGEGFLPLKRSRIRACTPATLKTVQDQRADGEYKDRFGKSRPLHLIKVGDRWWVSGYTLEYETDTDKRETVEALTELSLSLTSDETDRGEYLRPVIARIQAGEFKTAEDARKAMMEASRKDYESRRRSHD